MTADLPDVTVPQPRIVVRRRFQCVFCQFSRATKRLVVEHMTRCWSDPAKRTCKTCLHFERGRVTVTFSPYEPPEALDAPDECALGQDLPERAPAVDCPLWRDRDNEEDEPAEDAWNAGLRELDGDAR